MTDRELLELAAKAAGIDAEFHPELGSPEFQASREGMFLKGKRSPDNGKYWNPLIDDAGAFRLAVKLNLLIDCASHCARPIPDGIPWQDGNDLDPYAATRRAIVRAAAELAKQEKS